jgi:hypothetical protein
MTIKFFNLTIHIISIINLVVNGGILIMGGGELVTLFVDPMMSEPSKLLDALQINFLQPFYNFTFANGLIACLVFMGLCNACPIVLRCALFVERRQSIKIDGATIYFF